MPKLYLFDFFKVIFFSRIDRGTVNQELLAKIDELRIKSQTGIFSNSSLMLKTPFIRAILEKHFDYILSAQDLNLSKTDPEVYLQVAKKFKIKPEEILFIDDQESRIKAAHKAGCETILFEDNKQLFCDLSSRL